MKVEIFSDIACPFCFIGKRNFERALEAFPHDDEVEVIWRSFQLDPAAPSVPQGDNWGRLASKYGVSLDEAKAMGDRINSVAEGAGLELDLDSVLSVNTFDAHRLLHFARAAETKQKPGGTQDRLAEALFAAYFVAGENLADRQTLVRLAARAGLDPGLARTALDEDRFADAVRAEFSEAMELGLNGVPAFVIDRSLMVSGAQPPEILLGALQQASENRAGEAVS